MGGGGGSGTCDGVTEEESAACEGGAGVDVTSGGAGVDVTSGGAGALFREVSIGSNAASELEAEFGKLSANGSLVLLLEARRSCMSGTRTPSVFSSSCVTTLPS